MKNVEKIMSIKVTESIRYLEMNLYCERKKTLQSVKQ